MRRSSKRNPLSVSQQIKRVICIYALAFMGLVVGDVLVRRSFHLSSPQFQDAWVVGSTLLGTLAGLGMARIAQNMSWPELATFVCLLFLLGGLSIAGVNSVH